MILWNWRARLLLPRRKGMASRRRLCFIAAVWSCWRRIVHRCQELYTLKLRSIEAESCICSSTIPEQSRPVRFQTPSEYYGLQTHKCSRTPLHLLFPTCYRALSSRSSPVPGDMPDQLTTCRIAGGCAMGWRKEKNKSRRKLCCSTMMP